MKADKINIDAIVDDACAHATLELYKILDEGMEEQNRKTDSWMWDWANVARNAIPAAMSVALKKSLQALVDQLSQDS